MRLDLSTSTNNILYDAYMDDDMSLDEIAEVLISAARKNGGTLSKSGVDRTLARIGVDIEAMPQEDWDYIEHKISTTA